MGVKVIRIYELDGVVNARLELVGSFFEVEVPAGPVAGGYINKRLSFEQFTALLGSSYIALSLPSAQGFAAAGDVSPNTLYAITGDWNVTGTGATVYLHGVRPDAYHKLGVLYDAQAAGQLVEVDVAAGSYKKLSAGEPIGAIPFGPLPATGAAGETFALPAGTKSVRGVQVFDASPGPDQYPVLGLVASMYTLDATASPPTLTVKAPYTLSQGDTIEGIAFTTGATTPTPSTPSIIVGGTQGSDSITVISTSAA